MNVVRQFSQWFFFALFLILGGIFIYTLHVNFEQKEKDARQLRLEYVHNNAINHFSASINAFAGMVAGMRSHLNLSSEFPDARQFQRFVHNQFNDISSTDSIVVSFIDTTHVFQYSFTRHEIDPSGLVGTSVRSIVGKKGIANLDALMQHDSLRMFPPYNLVEGWVGLSMDFRVHREGRTLGYAAPILQFKTVMQDVYNSEVLDNFVFHFSTKNGPDFDRERVHNDIRISHDRVDPEYYKNYNADTSTFLYSTVRYYGLDFVLGTAYKDPNKSDYSFSRILLFWYLTFALLAFVVTLQMSRSKRLYRSVEKTNIQLEARREVVKLQNEKLRTLTTTQNKFFSIIGHDLKQPLSSIEGLLYLLQDEQFKDPALGVIVKELTQSTGNAVNLLNNLLRWAMSQTGDIKFTLAPVQFNKLIGDVVATLKHQAVEKEIELILDLDHEVSYQGDIDMLSTVIRNLLSNAFKFTDLGGAVIITTDVGPTILRMKVIDRGIGMSETKVASLFDQDDHFSTLGTADEKGTGLGLILCHDFVKRHGGTISVASELGKGTVFTVELPLQASINN